MVKRFTAVGASMLLVTATIGLASPAVADVPAPASKTPAIMPGPLKGAVLQAAMDAVSGAVAGTRSANVPIVAVNVTGPAQVVYNATYWYVCSQSPSAGNTISSKATAITLKVRRPNQKC